MLRYRDAQMFVTDKAHTTEALVYQSVSNEESQAGKENQASYVQYKTILNFYTLKYKLQTKLLFRTNELNRYYSSSAHMAHVKEENYFLQCYYIRGLRHVLRSFLHIYVHITCVFPLTFSYVHAICDLSFLNDGLRLFDNQLMGLKGVQSFFLFLRSI